VEGATKEETGTFLAIRQQCKAEKDHDPFSSVVVINVLPKKS
jgi:hypothetical protein